MESTKEKLHDVILFPNMIMDFTDMDHKEWEEARANHYGLDHFTIGGSDASTIMQVNKYKDLPQLYMEKLGEVHIEVNNDSVRMGNMIEPVIRQWFAEDHPQYEVYEWKALLQHPDYEWQVANVDGVYKNENGEWELLEIKNISSHMEKDWADGVPEYYYCQFQHYLSVTGLERGQFAVKFDSNKIRYFPVSRNNTYIHDMTFQQEMFIDRLINKFPPEITGSSSSSLLVDHLHPEGGREYEREKRGGGKKVEKEVLELEPDIGNMAAEIQWISDEVKQLEERKEELKNKIKLAMGDYQKAAYKNDEYAFSISWGNTKGKAYLAAEKLQEEAPDVFDKYRTKFDEKAFKEAEPELYKKYQERREGTRSFRITPKEVK